MRKFEAIVTQILSQLTYRHIPPEKYHYQDETSQTELSLWDFSFTDWRHFLYENIHDPSVEKRWVRVLREHFAKSVDYVAQEIWELLNICRLEGCQPVTYHCSLYPQLLRELADAPAALFCLGNPLQLIAPKIAVIGSRRSSERALAETRRLSLRLAMEEITVVSGGALGCDRAAHVGALDSEQLPVPSIAVMAGGLADLYPKANASLFRAMIDRGGLIVSERLWQTKPKPYDFPIRNRIISGLVGRVVVMEAASRSGAMVTANLALRQGRDVLVFEPEDDIRSQGSRSLIEDGATSFKNTEEFMEIDDIGLGILSV